jgi:hypothetical protein
MVLFYNINVLNGAAGAAAIVGAVSAAEVAVGAVVIAVGGVVDGAADPPEVTTSST